MTRSMSHTIVILSALLLGSLAVAQRIVVSPQAIVVNPDPAFDVDVWVDRDPTGRDEPAYTVGEPIEIGVRTTEDAYVYLYSVSASGEIVQILPNRFDDGGRDPIVRAGAIRTFPPQGARYAYVVEPPSGLAKVIAVASRRQLDTSTLASFSSEQDFMASSRLGEDGFARALSIVVQPLPQASWVTATALYHVGPRPAQGAFGTIAVTSRPSAAEVFVDGAFAGFTPLRYGARAGSYDVEVRAPAHASARERVVVQPDRVTDVDVALRPDARPVAPSAEPINAFLGLLPYPGSEITRQSISGRDSETTFTTSAGLGDVYEHFHAQLIADGWRRTDLEVDDDEIEAEYRRDGLSFELELERDGRNRYELEIDFD
jgi:hypothetical protein